MQPSWIRREAPWLALPIALCLAIRLPVADCALALFNGDAAVHLLMGRHLAHGELPLMFYGQGYVGSFEGWLCAPFYWLMGADVRGMGFAQAVLACVLVAQVYRLGWHLGGRFGALAASLPLAAGTRLLLANAAAQYGSYPSTQVFGLGAWLVALPMLRGRPVSARRLAALGALIGIGLWNNPQVSSFVAPLVALCYLRGTTLALWRTGRLGQALGAARWPLAALLCLTTSALLACLTWSFVLPQLSTTLVLKTAPGEPAQRIVGRLVNIPDGQRHIDFIGPDGKTQRRVFPPEQIDKDASRFAGEFVIGGRKISVTKPQKYMVKVILALLGLIGLIEVLLGWRHAQDKRRLALLISALGLGFLLGFSPMIGFAKTRDPDIKIKKAPVGLHPGMAVSHLRTLPAHLASALFDYPTPPTRAAIPSAPRLSSALQRAHAPSRWLLIGLASALLLGVLLIKRALWFDLMRLRPGNDPATALVLIASLVMLTLYLGFPQQANEARYLQAMWIPLAALYGGAIGWIRRCWPQDSVLAKRQGPLAKTLRPIGRGLAALGRRRHLLAALLIALLSASYGLGALHSISALRAQANSRYRVALPHHFEQFARQHGIRAGYANFWVGYPTSYRSDERLSLAPLPNESLRKYMPFVRRARAAQRRVWVFELYSSRLDEACYEQLLREGEVEDAKGWEQITHRRLIGNARAARQGDSAPFILFATRVAR